VKARSVCRGRALPLPARPSLSPPRILCFLTAHAALSLCVFDFLLVAVVRVPMSLGRSVLSLFTGRRRQLLDLHEGTIFPAEDPANYARPRRLPLRARGGALEDTAATARHCVPVCRRPSCVLLFCYMETPCRAGLHARSLATSARRLKSRPPAPALVRAPSYHCAPMPPSRSPPTPYPCSPAPRVALASAAARRRRARGAAPPWAPAGARVRACCERHAGSESVSGGGLPCPFHRQW